MASADLKDELLCSICLSLYTEPVMLRCGHNFCRDCIDQHLDTQDRSGGYSCPECRDEFQDRPVLTRNIALHNVAERLKSTPPQQEEVTGICCTYCVDFSVLAVKSCLLCEAFLCDKHLKVHSKSPDHVLTEITSFLENNQCPVHKEPLKLYCNKENICICVSCFVTGEHRGHQVEMLEEASEKKKKKLKNVLPKLKNKIKETEESVQNLEEQWRTAQEKASEEAKKANELLEEFRGGLDDLEKKRRLENLEKRVINEISRQERQVSLSLSDVIQKLEIKKDELSRKMKDIEELCNMTDPLTVLQEPDTGDLCDPEEGGGDEDTGGHDKIHDIDVGVIQGMLHAGISDIISYLQTITLSAPEEIRSQPPSLRSLPSHKQESGPENWGDDVMTDVVGEKVTAAEEGGIYGEGADILLDENTAHQFLNITDMDKAAVWRGVPSQRPHTAFQCLQVMSRGSFSSGRHYWDVEVSKTGEWRVGMCYPSIEKSGEHSPIGNNNKSWSLGRWFHKDCIVRHDGYKIQLPDKISSDRVRICVDYEAGELSFYELCDPIRHLHTFTTTFTEPLHAMLYVNKAFVRILE